jgi:hypothetical protein
MNAHGRVVMQLDESGDPLETPVVPSTWGRLKALY